MSGRGTPSRFRHRWGIEIGGRSAGRGPHISNLEAVIGELGRQMERGLADCRSEFIRGGSINRAYRLTAGDTRLFVKLNDAARIEMFAAEAQGLRELARAGAVRVPRVVALGCAGDDAFLALEWLDLAPPGAAAGRRLGRELAAQHRVTAAAHGWERDNTIGLTPQCNEPSDDWADFFCERRLGYQLRLAQRNALPREAASALRELLAAVPTLLAEHEPVPSLLHGDLWGGNWGALRDGSPIVFDPAVYYGDRETDLAMTRLFGGFGHEFYSDYMDAFPLSSGWERRTDLYNLYHLLNHFNLFGSAYIEALCSTTARLLRELR